MAKATLEQVGQKIAAKINKKVAKANPGDRISVKVGWWLRRHIHRDNSWRIHNYVNRHLRGASPASMGSSYTSYFLDSLDFSVQVDDHELVAQAT